ncbi:unnamed protein product [Ostreobium quekettii]|uniref:Uncharacterized protein n=1 Tax=Ostreobium quekettii TaxID=121088 RepID=A0A8S1IPV0_9CHLO|nr:unnamed protein product [Ostreobium quekettii]
MASEVKSLKLNFTTPLGCHKASLPFMNVQLDNAQRARLGRRVCLPAMSVASCAQVPADTGDVDNENMTRQEGTNKDVRDPDRVEPAAERLKRSCKQLTAPVAKELVFSPQSKAPDRLGAGCALVGAGSRLLQHQGCDKMGLMDNMCPPPPKRPCRTSRAVGGTKAVGAVEAGLTPGRQLRRTTARCSRGVVAA